MATAVQPSSPFGLVVGGRALLTNPQAVQADPAAPPRSWVFRFPAQPAFSHVTVFMDPAVPLAQELAVAVYISLPQSSPSGTPAQQQYKFMGALTSEKPSAVYKLSMPAHPQQQQQQGEGCAMMDMDAAAHAAAYADHSLPALAGDAVVELGLQLEAAAEVAPRLAALEAERAARRGQLAAVARPAANAGGGAPSAVGDPAALKAVGLKIAQNLFNYLSGFAVPDASGSGRGDVVPMDAFRRWWDKFQAKVENDPAHLLRDAE
ncbi:hypothetical protein KEM52_001947 [Ascosphaera acerosa]|nr:hypothetical protein KEM52_001947 [Ascosphaera acerosa]